MFDRFVRLAQTKRALSDGQLEAALTLLDDPLVRDHRRAVVLRRAALKALAARAARRAREGSLLAAISDIDLVLRRDPSFDGAAALRADLYARVAQAEAKDAAHRGVIGQVRAAIESGALVAAERFIAAAEREGRPELVDLQATIASRRAAARAHLRSAEAAIARGDLSTGREALIAAQAMDQGLQLQHAREALAGAETSNAVAHLRGLSQRNAPLDVLREFRRRCAVQPGLEVTEDVRAIVDAAIAAARPGVVAALGSGDAERVLHALTRLDETERDVVLDAIGTSIAEFRGIVDTCRRGRHDVAGQQLRQLAERLRVPALDLAARACDRSAENMSNLLRDARGAVAEGDVARARQILLQLFESCPMHEDARREMEILDQGVRERDRRIVAARELAAAGRLREAAASTLALAVAGPAGEEARMLLRDIQNRMDSVQRGLSQVQRDAHGRASGSRDGIVQGIARLQELRRVQTDEPELDRMIAAFVAELDGLAALDRAAAAAEAGVSAEVLVALDDYGAACARLLSPDRLESRFLAVVDAAITKCESLLAAGRSTAAGDLLAAFTARCAARPIGARLTALVASIETRNREVVRLVELGVEALGSRDVDAAEQHLAAARLLANDRSEVVRLDDRVRAARACASDLARVEALADDDVTAARMQLDRVGAGRGLFRTRIFDLKKNLARAQGLDHRFVLRVDEGGEFVVCRGETITIGNLRDGTADLPILARISGRHARIRRVMSFHGGMQDSIEAEQGELFVDGKRATAHVLRHGSVVRLGSSLELAYRLPCRRSLTAVLALRGFSVAGTDKVLLMKDRGRDGRIVIGRGSDVHVQVPTATAEVEIYATREGQVRVRFDGKGTMDGRPFSGDEPVNAGAVVSCGTTSFVLQPWTKS